MISEIDQERGLSGCVSTLSRNTEWLRGIPSSWMMKNMTKNGKSSAPNQSSTVYHRLKPMKHIMMWIPQIIHLYMNCSL